MIPVRLGPADIPEVMRIERTPGFEAFIGRFTHEEHLAQLASADAWYMGVRGAGGLDGFVILQEFREPTVLLRRIALSEPGGGRGGALFRASVDWIFANTDAVAVKLHVAKVNDRARHIYSREGFTIYSSDETGDRMSVSRETWTARP